MRFLQAEGSSCLWSQKRLLPITNGFEKGRAIQQLIYGGRMRENLKDLPGSFA